MDKSHRDDRIEKSRVEMFLTLGPAEEEGLEHRHRVAEAGRAEEDPPHQDPVQGQHMAGQLADDPDCLEPGKPLQILLVDDQRQPMHATPDNKGPGGPVPETTEQHRQHQVAMGEELAAAIASERDVQIIPQS